ncbi:response regulator [Salinisphaera sp.]|uniref:response regulator n=1 Tax=Salinisphaera sp. TaxID=1914330 RepID=UPI002D781B1E|nr:response regulator [Salinisphaera sp.]HET7313060.1 response regulator [Salinisphaera sp.]
MTNSTEHASPLAGLRILLVEDEMALAMALETLLKTMEARALKAARVEKALTLIEREPLDGALVDINLGGTPGYPVAAELDRRGIPFVFMTGYHQSAIAEPWRDRPVLSKPFDDAQLERVAATTFRC